MKDDAALLRRYVDERSEAALAEVVRRHHDLVAAAARRWMQGDPAAGAALVQEVFNQLAEEAASIRRHGLVVSWLHAATLRASAGPEAGAEVVVRLESGPAAGSEDAIWDPAVDQALDELSVDDRSALLLHLAERRSLAEVGVALNLSADAAQLHVARALDKLRAVLARRGTRLGVSTLREILSVPLSEPLPEGRAEEIAGRAIASALAEVALGEEKRGFRFALVGLVNSGKALGLVALIVAGGALIWGYRANAKIEAEITRLQGESQTLASLQRDNRRLSRLEAEAEELRKVAAELPALRAAAFPEEPRPLVGSAVVTVSAPAGLQWDGEEVAPVEFLRRLGEFQRRHPAPETRLMVQVKGAAISAVAYVVNEARKARLTQIVIEGDASPGDGDGAATWF